MDYGSFTAGLMVGIIVGTALIYIICGIAYGIKTEGKKENGDGQTDTD